MDENVGIEAGFEDERVELLGLGAGGAGFEGGNECEFGSGAVGMIEEGGEMGVGGVWGVF